MPEKKLGGAGGAKANHVCTSRRIGDSDRLGIGNGIGIGEVATEKRRLKRIGRGDPFAEVSAKVKMFEGADIGRAGFGGQHMVIGLEL